MMFGVDCPVCRVFCAAQVPEVAVTMMTPAALFNALSYADQKMLAEFADEHTRLGHRPVPAFAPDGAEKPQPLNEVVPAGKLLDARGRPLN